MGPLPAFFGVTFKFYFNVLNMRENLQLQAVLIYFPHWGQFWYDSWNRQSRNFMDRNGEYLLHNSSFLSLES